MKQKTKKRLLSLLMVIAMLFSNVEIASAAESFTDDASSESASQLFRTARADGVVPTYQEAYEAMIALKTKYPEGLKWTNYEPYGNKGDKGPYYRWKGGVLEGNINGGVGCAALAMILSDEAFGNLPGRIVRTFTYEDIKVGDILRVNYDSHFVIVLQKSVGGIIVAEGNFNKSVHWGRAISKEQLMAPGYMPFIVTRYPVGYTESEDADEVAHSGTEGSLNWTLTNGGTLTISGTGNMLNYTTDKAPAWNAYDNINTIIIENGVTNIGDYAFYGSNALAVYIPDGVTSIGTGAFQESDVVAVTIPGTTTKVGNNAFRECENLTSASISDGVKTIGDNAFRACTSMTYIDFPASITSVGAGAFMDCSQVTQIRFAPGTGNVTIGDGTFTQCWYLTNVTLPQGLTKISNYMFQSCTLLSEIYIPASVTDIGELPFTSTRIQYGGTIYFGGSQTTWRSIGGQFILNAMPNAKIVYDVDFDNPFAIDPNDPGDLILDNPVNSEKPDNTENSENTDDSENTGDSEKISDSEKTGDSENTGNTEKPETYKYAQKVKGKCLYDSKNKKVAQYTLKKGILTYKGKKTQKIKNVKEAGYRTNGNLVYRLKNGTVKEINHVTLKTRTLYKKSIKIKKLVKNKKNFVTKVKTKSNKTKNIKK